ncbi:MAG: sensor histidine kinase [Paraclostridium sp.]
MRLKDFLIDKSMFISINLIMFILVSVAVLYSKTQPIMIFMLFIIWFGPLISYILIDYIKWKKYINNINGILDNLDKKYLLPEVIDDANFLVGEEINYILSVLSKDMHENVKVFKTMQEEYREYIESWVHEIKTPIASTKLVIENNENEVTKKIDSQLDKIDNFVEQVLYYAKSDEVEKDYIIKKLSLDKVIKNVVRRNYKDFISKKISLQLNIGEDEVVYSDAKWLEFIINQILGNAIKYSKTKNGVIKITSKKEKNYVVLIIEDNGVGIIERDINRVFEKGFTGENGRVFGKSTGMGLYICKRLCDKLGLGLNVDSKLEIGTKVGISFPLQDEV